MRRGRLPVSRCGVPAAELPGESAESPARFARDGQHRFRRDRKHRPRADRERLRALPAPRSSSRSGRSRPWRNSRSKSPPGRSRSGATPTTNATPSKTPGTPPSRRSSSASFWRCSHERPDHRRRARLVLPALPDARPGRAPGGAVCVRHNYAILRQTR